MCGIFGIASKSEVAFKMRESLKRLDYRGYDSVGVATIFEGKLWVKKDAGKIEEVHARLNLDDLPGIIGISQTRWATHGNPTKINAHPHLDCSGTVAVVHNGIIENYDSLRLELKAKGHIYRSGTDTEVVCHLIEDFTKDGLSLFEAVRQAVKRLEGSYALAIISTREPEKIICVKHESPMVLGVGTEEMYCASDVPAFLPYTKQAVYIEEGEMAVLTNSSYDVFKIVSGEKVTRTPELIEWSVEMAEKQGYPHFTLKEIHEQPRCLLNSLRLRGNYLDLMTTFLDHAEKTFLIGCGTSHNACIAGTYMFSKIAAKTVAPVIASEFINRISSKSVSNAVVLALTQSGETADVLSAVDFARQNAATILSLTNTIGSAITRLSWVYAGMQAGPEIGVAATKTFTSQLSVLAQLSLALAKQTGKISQDDIDFYLSALKSLPETVQSVLDSQEEKVKQLVKKYAKSPFFLFLGGGPSTATAYEGALKLMELAYVPTIAVPSGESKHGPISLVERGIPAIIVCPPGDSRRATINNMAQLKARGASVIAIISEGDDEVKGICDDYVEIPNKTPEVFSPITYVVPLQLFAYYMAVEKGCDPDRPRNLAKSVTVK
jgi:glucosamine--fructose-6-phosphate aminotransferase (isomerizing)